MKNIILFNNLDNVIKEPTRLTATSTTLIDPILFSNSFGNYKAGCLDIGNNISDHNATYIHIQSMFNTNSCTTRKVWFYQRANVDLFNELVASENWDFFNTSTVDVACAQFTNKIHDFINLCIPSKVVTIRPNDKPWYDSEIRMLSKYRDRKRRISLVSNTTSSWSKYKRLRNKVNKLKKFAKQHFFTI